VTTISTDILPPHEANHRPHLAVQILGLLAFTGFAIVATVMAFVMFWLAGVILTLAFVWFGFRPLLGGRSRSRAEADLGPVMPSAPRSGNASFDAYRHDVLQRLEDEQASFDGFLARLRDAKDAREFDSFMEDRARSARDVGPTMDGEENPRRGEY
jgi:hypothetical protein